MMLLITVHRLKRQLKFYFTVNEKNIEAFVLNKFKKKLFSLNIKRDTEIIVVLKK